MQYLKNLQLSAFYHASHASGSRFVYQTNPTALDIKLLSEDDPDTFLENPTIFALRHLRILEEEAIAGRLSEAHKQKFRHITQYFLDVGTDLRTKPPHRMIGEILKRPKLMSFLSQNTKKNLEIRVDSRVKELQEIVKGIDAKKDITSTDIVRIVNLYKYLEGHKKYGITKGGTLETTFKKTMEVLVGEVNKLLAKIKKGTNTWDLDSAEIALCLEVRRLFPAEKWATRTSRETWRQMAIAVANDINPADDTDTTDAMRHPRLTGIWDILNDIAESNDPDYAALQTPEITNRIRDLLERGNGVPLLEWAQGEKKSMPPEQLKGIIRIAEKTPHKGAEKNNLWMEEIKKLEDKVSDINKEIAKKKKEIKDYEDEFYDEIKNDPLHEKTIEYNDAKDKAKIKYQDLIDNFTLPAIDNLDDIFATTADPALQARTAAARTQFNAIQPNPTAPDYLENAQALLDELGDIYDKANYKDIIADGSSEQRKYKNFKAKHEEGLKEIKKIEDADLAIRASVPLPDDLDKKRKEKEKEITDNRIERKKIERESTERKQYLKNFYEGTETANEKIAEYLTALDGRITKNEVNNEDIQVLLNLDDIKIGSRIQPRLSTLQANQIRDLRDVTQNILVDIARRTNGLPLDALITELSTGTINNLITASPNCDDLTAIFGANCNIRLIIHGIIQFHLPEMADQRTDPDDMRHFNQIHLQKLEAIKSTQEKKAKETTFAEKTSTQNPADIYEFLEKERKEFDAHMESIHNQEFAYFLSRFSALSDAAQQSLLNQIRAGDMTRAEILHELQNIPWNTIPDNWNASAMTDKLMLQGTFTGGNGILYGDLSTYGEINNLTIAQSIEHTAPEAKQLRTLIQSIQNEWTDLHMRAMNGEDISSELNDSWLITRSQIIGILTSMESQCETHNIFTPTQRHQIFTEARNRILSNIESLLPSAAARFTGLNDSWMVLYSKLGDLLDTFDFRNGVFGRLAKDNKEAFATHNEGLGILKKNGFFEDETPNKDDFRRTFRKTQIEFTNAFSHYEEKLTKVLRTLKYDLKQYANHHEEFELKYPEMSYEYAQNMVEMYEEQHLELRDLAHRFGNNPRGNREYFDEWFEKYNTSDEKRAEALRDLKGWEEIGDFAKTAREGIDQFDAYLNEYEKYQKENPMFSFENRKLEKFLGRPTRKTGNALLTALGVNPNTTYQVFSITDIGRIINQILETNQLRQRRMSDKAVANIGVFMFSEKNAYGKEFKRLGEDSEGKRVSEFESQYGDSEGWDILDQLYNTKDPDEGRALINLASQKGFLKWDDPKLWRTLMKLQNQVQFFIPEDTNLSMDEIRAKVKQACGAIWSNDIFDNWQAGFDGNLSSAKGRFSLEFMTMANSGGLDNAMATMLKKWKAGETEDINPAQFEHFLFESWDQGKINGVPDRRWYYFIQALTLQNPSGQTILSRETIDRVNGTFLARIPMFDFFLDGSPKHKGRLLPEGHPDGVKRAWNIDDFREWAKMMGTANGSFYGKDAQVTANVGEFYYQIVAQSSAVKGRVERMQRISSKENDHDDAAAFTPFWNSDAIGKAFQRDSAEQDKHTPSFLRNFMSGFDMYFKENHALIAKYDEQYGGEQWWKDEREKKLMEIGERLRAAMTGMMIIQGSNPGVGGRPSISSELDIEVKDGLTNGNFADSRDFIFGMMGNLVDEKEKDPHKKAEFKRLMQVNGNKYSTRWVTAEKKLNENEPGVVDKLRAITSANYEEGGKYYQDTDAIWTMLQKQYK